MLREDLGSRYVLLAEGFSSRGDYRGALACVLMAHRLGYDCTRAHQVLQAAADRPVEAEPARSACDLTCLSAAKQKLDRLACAELAVAGDRLEDCVGGAEMSAGASTTSDGRMAPAALVKEMERLKGRMKRERGTDAKRIARQMELLVARVQASVADVPAVEAETNRHVEHEDDGWGELSLEHEVHNAGNDFYRIGMFQEAIEAYDVALEIRPDLLETYFNRGLARVRLGRYQEAMDDLNRVLDLNDGLAEAWYTRGLVREYMLEYDNAIADYRRALEVEPDYKKAQEQIEVARRKKSPTGGGAVGSSETYRSGTREEGVIADFSTFLMKSTLRFRDVGGCEEAIRSLTMASLYLAGDPVVEEFGGQVPAGILLWGPKGVGKTRCVQALAGEVGCRVYALPPTALMDMWAGNSEKNTRNLWAEAAAHAPSIIYVDEIDGFLSRRTREAGGEGWYNKMITTVLYLMSQVSDRGARVLLVGATNRISAIDTAFLRPGRFDEVIRVERPNARALASVWLIQLEKAERAAQRVDFLSEELSRAVHFDRTEWMELAMKPEAQDGSGIPELARICEQRKLTGADVVGVIRATIADRIYAKKELGIDLGPIGPSDLKTQLRAYEPPQWRSRRGSTGKRSAE